MSLRIKLKGDKKITGKMKQCFTTHVLMHSLFGLGLGLLLADIWDSLAKWWIGVGLMVIASVYDMMRKK